ncbi:LytR/AlgR family response regulator transcription factor [Mucilaginibacter sp. RCC_168]|uniref:LytR/AlgR family response regulator transcription factor n=1 Tax=Mucilaginibacter sp. RCC_168 TaxID=3239221 RepID=UPI0035259562
MNVAIIDDERPAIALLSAYIQRTNGLLLESTFTDPMDALGHYNYPNPPEITFLDVDMPGITGIDFARIVGPRTRIILTTSFRNYGPEAFELAVYDYLLKPFSYERFLTAVEKVMSPGEAMKPPVLDYFFIRTETRGKYLKINIQEIISVESKDNIVLITLPSGNINAMHTLSNVQAWLPAGQFFRIHRSFVVNLSQVLSVDHGQVWMTGNTAIPIGRQYREDFMLSLNKLMINGRQ